MGKNNITAKLIIQIAETEKQNIIDAITPHINERLKKYALKLDSGNIVDIGLENIIIEEFYMGDENQIYCKYFYNLGDISKQEILLKLSESYQKQGFLVDSRVEPKDDKMCKMHTLEFRIKKY